MYFIDCADNVVLVPMTDDVNVALQVAKAHNGRLRVVVEALCTTDVMMGCKQLADFRDTPDGSSRGPVA